MRYLVYSSANVGDVAIDVPLLKAIVRNGHHLEVCAGENAADVLADCTFISRLYRRNQNPIGKLAADWRVSRRHWDVMLFTSLWASRLRPIRFLARARQLRDRTDMITSMYSNGAVVYRLSILDGLVDDWDAPIEAEIPYRSSRRIAALKCACIGEGETFLTVAPGSAKESKRWSMENFATVLNEIKNDYAHIVVVGSATESDLCCGLAASCGAKNVAGKLGLAETCALVSHASQHIGNDSGLSHVAAGNNVKTLSIGGWLDGHYTPWRQQMIHGPVSDIEPSQVLAALSGNFSDVAEQSI